MHESNDGLYQRHRPQDLAAVKGQKAAVAVVQSLIAKPDDWSCALFTGPSGTGKTTLARILRDGLGVSKDWDWAEYNSASERGVAFVRDIQSRSGMLPAKHKYRLVLLDEAHQLTNDAQNALLKLLEDPKPHFKTLLCTTEPEKLKAAIRTRSTEVPCEAVDDQSLFDLLVEVAEKEGRPDIPDDVLSAVASEAGGSPRRALVMLLPMLGMSSADDMRLCLKSTQGPARTLAQILCDERHAGLAALDECRLALKAVAAGDVESVRRGVLGYAEAVLLGNAPAKKKQRAASVLKAFRFDCFHSGRPGLTAMCLDVLMAAAK